MIQLEGWKVVASDEMGGRETVIQMAVEQFGPFG
jgi:hypothetical protein